MSDPDRGFRIPARVWIRLGLYFAFCWTIVAVLLAGAFPGAVAVVIALALYTTLPLLVFLRSGGWPFYPSAGFRLFVVRPFWYVQLALPLVSAAGILGLIAGFPFGPWRSAGRVSAATTAAAIVVGFIVGYAWSRRLVVHRLQAVLPTLPAPFDGLTIAQITDLHVGPHTPRGYLRRVARTLETLAPDLIAVTGDLIDDRSEDVADYAAAFGGLRAPLGVFLVAGNHDVYAGWNEVEPALEKSNVGTLLVNETQALRRGDDTIYLAGVGDPAGGRSRAGTDIRRTLSGLPHNATVIALAHNPGLWPALAERGVALTLSGHTHWGQFSLPRLGWSLASPFLELAMGGYQRGDSLLYIAPGTGYFGIPFRIGAPAEISLVTLRRGPAEMRDLGAK